MNALLTMAPVVPERDAPLIHAWVDQERAEFWGMRGKPLEEVRDIYTWIDEHDHVAAYLVSWQGTPRALFQTYDPFVDEIGEFYDRQPGDVGVHLLIGPGERPDGFSRTLFGWLLDWVFADPAHQRVVVEPDVRNAKSLAAMDRLGAARAHTADLPEKTAQFGFLTRAQWAGPA
ncbi:GNAT family N-acetyltransferase [Nocardioides sp. AE5]|uniref:GNAT family N-acetyltransferase n=1 Tax=Nocardioides sp. AE5 TaxID=2962573 RepID=UPI002882471A|nr:GNAT family N-acetyltransferase [Nocardioides sp. AE5]MDT0203012.1 GNAT family N-acetyltransferase [Nocardioides sp. AE5]